MQPPSDDAHFSVRTRSQPNARETIVMVSGDLDLTTADELDRFVKQEMRAGPVLLDLRDVAFIDSSGLRALDGLVRHSQGEGLRIDPELSPTVAQILELTGMMHILPLADREEGP